MPLFKKVTLWVLISVFGIIVGIWIRSNFVRFPIDSEWSVVHYCGCVEDHPENQELLFKAAYSVNQLIKDKTKEFSAKHDIASNDFTAVFILNSNGNYEIKSWCSNRTSKIFGLQEEYNKVIDSSLEPYRVAIDKAHEVYHKK